MYQENISCMCLLTKREGRHAVSLFVCFFFLPFSEITGFFFSQFVSCKAEEGWSSQPKYPHRLRACSLGSGGPQVGQVPHLPVVKES